MKIEIISRGDNFIKSIYDYIEDHSLTSVKALNRDNIINNILNNEEKNIDPIKLMSAYGVTYQGGYRNETSFSNVSHVVNEIIFENDKFFGEIEIIHPILKETINKVKLELIPTYTSDGKICSLDLEINTI